MVSTNNRYIVSFDSSNSNGYLTNSFFNTEVLITNGSYQGDKDKIYRIIGGIEIYRNENSCLWMSLGNELDANSKNDIHFNPRQSLWEENLNYSMKLSSNILNVGFFYRCKHEIDNSDSPSGDTITPGYIPTKRVMIVEGLNLSLMGKSNLNNKLDIKYGGEVEYYFVPDDYRQGVPAPYIKPDWNQLTSSLKLNLRINYNFNESINLYSRLKADIMLFTRNTTPYIETNSAIEIGASFKGIKYSFDFFFQSERHFDELAFLVPHQTSFTGIGIRLRGNNFY